MIGVLNGLQAAGLVVNNAKEAFVSDGPSGVFPSVGRRIWKMSGGGAAALYAGGGSTAVTSTVAYVARTSADLGVVRGLALDSATGEIFVVGSQYFRISASGVRLATAAFSAPPAPSYAANFNAPPFQFTCPDLIGGGLNIHSFTTSVAPAAFAKGSPKLLYAVNNNARTLEVVNLEPPGAASATVWPTAGCGMSPVVVPAGERRVLLAPKLVDLLPPPPPGVFNPLFLQLPFQDVGGLAVGADGDLYFTDRLSQQVFAMSGKTGCRTLIGGKLAPKTANPYFPTAVPLPHNMGQCGFSGDTASPVGAAFFDPTGVALNASGDLLVADTANRRLRIIYNNAPGEDSDGDGVPNDFETIVGSSSLSSDSDSDGVGDGNEMGDGTNPANPDSDNDGTDDGTERGPGPTPQDTDMDGIPDALEPFTEKSSVTPIPSESTLWLVTVKGKVYHRHTNSLSSCITQQTAQDLKVFDINAPRHFIRYDGTVIGTVGIENASSPVPVGPGTFSVKRLKCEAGNGTQQYNYSPGPGITCEISRSCAPLTPGPTVGFVGNAPFGQPFEGVVSPEPSTADVYTDTGHTKWRGPMTFSQDAYPNYSAGAAPLKFKIPIARFRLGRKFPTPVIGAITELGTNGSTITSFYVVNAEPARPIIDDILTANYVPEVGTYPTTLQARMEPATFDGVNVEAKLKVTLYDTTQYPGCAMNANNGVAPCSTRAGIGSADRDVRFAPTTISGCNTMTDGLLDCSSTYKTQISYNLDVEDFGAYSKIKAEALWIKVGSNQFDFSTAAVKGRVLGRPEDERFTTLPIDRGPDNGQGVPGSIAGNRIADVGWKAVVNAAGATVDIGDSRPAGQDTDRLTAAGGIAIGDGFAVLDEYRGFRVRGIHRRLDPQVTDLLLTSAFGMNDTQYASTALPLRSHVLDALEMSPTQVVVTNPTSSSIAPFQHGVRISVDNVRLDYECPLTGTSGTAFTCASVPNSCTAVMGRAVCVGTPNLCSTLTLFPAAVNCTRQRAQLLGAPSVAPVLDWIRFVQGHEVGHGVALDHNPIAAGQSISSEASCLMDAVRGMDSMGAFDPFEVAVLPNQYDVVHEMKVQVR